VVGDTFVIATFEDRLNDSKFASISTRGYGSDVRFSVIYNEHDLTLAVTAVPEPENWAMFLAGLGLMVSVFRRKQTPAANGA
jgi:hypothetical protein